MSCLHAPTQLQIALLHLQRNNYTATNGLRIVFVFVFFIVIVVSGASVESTCHEHSEYV